jgi:hypothetical protein
VRDESLKEIKINNMKNFTKKPIHQAVTRQKQKETHRAR